MNSYGVNGILIYDLMGKEKWKGEIKKEREKVN
jgi:hypothetical protein